MEAEKSEKILFVSKIFVCILFESIICLIISETSDWDCKSSSPTMEVSNEIKEDIRKTQTDLKNAIRIHQVWVSRLQEDEDNIHLRTKVEEAEKDIIAIGQAQKLVVDRLRKELELYQQRLQIRNKHVNIENDNCYVAQQLKDHRLQYRGRNRTMSLLKPSVLNEIHVKAEKNHIGTKVDECDSDDENKLLHEKENSNHSESDEREPNQQNYQSVHQTRNNFVNVLNKVKESLIESKRQQIDWHGVRSDSDSYQGIEHSPSPSPPPLPEPGVPINQEVFLRLVGLVTNSQKEILIKKRNERRKRSTTSTNKTDFLYGDFDMMPKRKKYPQFSYLQAHNEPPQTRSAKLRKQMPTSKSSREGSPSGSENKVWNNKPAWAASLPPSLSVEPISSSKKVCNGCGRNDVPSLLVRCVECLVWTHTGCAAAGRCAGCDAPLPEPRHEPTPDRTSPQLFRDKLIERKRLQEKNIELCHQLRKLELRAASLKENLDEHNAEKRQLLSDQIKTQRNIKRLLDFLNQFKETSSSESASEVSRSNEE